MNDTRISQWLGLGAMSLALTVPCAQAQTPAEAPGQAPSASLASVQQTTQALIDALVQKGVLTREAADAMLAQARQKADAEAAVKPAPEPVSGQRVPYLSPAQKAQIRNEVREEVMTQARAERWGVPGATPSWVDRLRIEGDFRYRHQSDRPLSDNTPAVAYQASIADTSQGLMRAPEFALSDGNNNTRGNATEGRSRERIRLRLGLIAKVSDDVGVGVRLATGNADDRVSTNQTLGNNFNKVALFVDRAFVKLDGPWGLSAQLGRMANPWLSTDMVWSENLNFDGLAFKASLSETTPDFEPFFTAGAFPLRDEQAPLRSARWLYGAQAGAAWQLGSLIRIKGGLAYYQYRNIAGREDTDYRIDNGSFVPGASFGQYSYPVGSLGQKGNTLFETNPVSAPLQSNGLPYYGLAYNFRPVVLTLTAEFTHFAPYSLLATFEYVRNTAFSVSDFQRRAGSSYQGVDPGGRATGYHVRLGLGYAEVRDADQWQLFASYKHVGSDAVVDAFTDSDMALGGTNVRGYTLGGLYGIQRNTSVGVRVLNGRSIDSPINTYNPDARWGVTSVQADLNVRF